nr:cytochrome P450 798B1 [Ginkgo biloba]
MDLSIATVLVLLLTIIAYAVKRRKCQWRGVNIPPGSMGLPLLGESVRYLINPEQFVNERTDLYGKLFRTKLFGIPTVFSTNAETNKFILSNEGSLFVPGYPESLKQMFGEWGFSSLRGEMHKRMRGVTLRFLNTEVLRNSLLSTVENSLVDNFKTWDGRTVNVLDEAQQITFSFIADQLISLNSGEELEKLKRDFHILKNGLFSLQVKVPGTTYYKSLQARRRLVNQMTNIIEDRRKLMSHNDPYDDLLSTLLKSREDDHIKYPPLTSEQMLDFLMSMFLAGFDATARTMTTIVQRLSEAPNVVKKLREEHKAIKQHKKEGEMLSWHDYKEMTFTRIVLKEILRLGINFSAGVYRETVRDVEIQGYTIPKGWKVISYSRSSHLDSKFYKDPLCFNPWRWQEKDVNETVFAPFGGGNRLCPGNELALLQASFFIHFLVTKFSWKLIDPQPKGSWFRSGFIFYNDILIEPRHL